MREYGKKNLLYIKHISNYDATIKQLAYFLCEDLFIKSSYL